MGRIVILGSGPSINQYKYNPDDTIYVPGRSFNVFKEKASMYFCIHGDERDRLTDIKKAGMPFMISGDFPKGYYTSTIAYMLAYAIANEPERIELYGVDCEPDTEWAYERPCILYYVGIAEGKGIDVFMANDWRKPVFQYGPDEKYYLPLIEKLGQREKELIDRIKREPIKERREAFTAALSEVVKLKRSVLT